VEIYPSWRATLDIARCLQKMLQGDHPAALAALEPALREIRLVEHRDWAWAAGCHVRVLTGLGRAYEAVELGLESMRVCEREQLNVGYSAQATAAALIAIGKPQQAAELADRLISDAAARGVSGIMLGSLLELRAQAAAACGDEAGLRAWLARCATAYRIDRNPALAARCQRLARGHAPDGPAQAASVATAASSHSATLSTVNSRLLECSDHATRARCVLGVLAERVQAERAYLYAERENRLRLLCGLPDDAPPDALAGAVERYLERAIEHDKATVMEELTGAAAHDVGSNATTNSLFDDAGSSVLAPASTVEPLLVHSSGLRLYPVLLEMQSGGERAIAGIATLAIRGDAFVPPPRVLLAVLASALLENDDVDPVTVIGTVA
jgi:hypothetical protein